MISTIYCWFIGLKDQNDGLNICEQGTILFSNKKGGIFLVTPKNIEITSGRSESIFVNGCQVGIVFGERGITPQLSSHIRMFIFLTPPQVCHILTTKLEST
jgi:hypothetical protein